MSTPERLMGVGMAPEVAKRIGYTTRLITTASGVVLDGPGNFFVQASGATVRFVLGPGFDIGDQVIIGAKVEVTVSAGGIAINNSSVAGVTADACKMLTKFSSTQWWIMPTLT